MIDVSKIVNVLFELEYYKIDYYFTDETIVKIPCPFHKDTYFSCYIDLNKRRFYCRMSGCERRGDMISLIAAVTGKSSLDIKNDFIFRYLDVKDTRGQLAERLEYLNKEEKISVSRHKIVLDEIEQINKQLSEMN